MAEAPNRSNFPENAGSQPRQPMMMPDLPPLAPGQMPTSGMGASAMVGMGKNQGDDPYNVESMIGSMFPKTMTFAGDAGSGIEKALPGDTDD